MWDIALSLGVSVLAAYLPDNNLWLLVIRYLHRSYTISKIVAMCYHQIVTELKKQHHHRSVLSPLPLQRHRPLHSHPLTSSLPAKHYLSNYSSKIANKTSQHITEYSSLECTSKLNHYTYSGKSKNLYSESLASTSTLLSSNSSRTLTSHSVTFTGKFNDFNSIPLNMNNINARNVSSGWYYGPVNNYRPLTGPRPPIHRIDTTPDTNLSTRDRQYCNWNRSYVQLNQYNLNSLPLTDNYLRVTQWLKQYVYPRLEQWQTSAELNSHRIERSSNKNCSNRSSTPIPGTNIPYDGDEYENDDDYDDNNNCIFKTKL